MTRPILKQDEKTGRLKYEENPSIVNKLHLKTEIMLAITLVRSAITFATVQKMSRITEKLDVDDTDLENMELSDDENELEPTRKILFARGPI